MSTVKGGGVDNECSTTGTFKCETCGRKFEHKKDLLHHAYIHKENPKYDCQVCGKILTSKVGFDRHMGTHAKDKKNTVYCRICHQECSSKTKLEEHHRKNHLEQKPFSCEVCKAEFSWEENLHKHRRMHLEENYQCKFCRKVFVDTISLKVHMRNHNQKKNAFDNLKPYGCNLCGQRFQYDFSYNAHMRLHDAGAVDKKDMLKEDIDTKAGENIDYMSEPESSQNEHNQPYKTFLGKRSVHLKKKTTQKGNSDNIKAIDPELQNAEILPAFETPKGYKPYPQIRGLTKTENVSCRDSKDFRKKSAKSKNSVINKEKKVANKRFGDLTMTEETPFKCSYCAKQFRWEVSLKVHIDEHVNGTKKLSEAEIRRQKRFAAEKRVKRTLSQNSDAEKCTISPKKSRLVNRKAGSDDEDSEEENFIDATRSPNKATNAGESVASQVSKPGKTYGRSGARHLSPRQSHDKTTHLQSGHVDDASHVQQARTVEKLKSVEMASGTSDAPETRENELRTTQTETIQTSSMLDQDLLGNGGVERTQHYMSKNSTQYSYDSVPENAEATSEQSFTSNQVLENVTNTGDNRGQIQSPKKIPKAKSSKSDIVRRSRRLAGDDTPQFDTINTAQMLDKCDVAANDPAPLVVDNAYSSGHDSQLSYTSYEPRAYNENLEVKDEPQNVSREITERVSDFSSLGPSFFYPGETHEPVLANLINDDKSIEQVRVVECIKLNHSAESETNPTTANFATSVAEESPYVYNDPSKYAQSNVSTVTESRTHSNEGESVYTDLSHSVVNLQTSEGQMIQQHFSEEGQTMAQYQTVHPVNIPHVNGPGRTYQDNSNNYPCDKSGEESAEVSGRGVMDVNNYVNSGDSFNSTSRNYTASQSNESTESYTEMVYSATFDNSSSNPAQNIGNFEVPEPEKAPIVNVQVTTAPIHSESFVAPPLFALSQGGDLDNLGHSNIPVVSAMPGFAPYHGGIVDNMQSLSPTNRVRESDLIPVKTFKNVPTSSSDVSHTTATVSFNSMMGSGTYNTVPQNQETVASPPIQSLSVNASPVQQPRHTSLEPVQNSDTTTETHVIAHQQGSIHSNLPTFSAAGFGTSAQSEQLPGQIPQQGLINVNSERLKITQMSELNKQTNETVKTGHIVEQSQTVVPANLSANQNQGLIASQSVMSQQIGSRLVLQNGSIVQSHISQSALSTNIQQGLVLNNGVQPIQTHTAKSQTSATVTSQTAIAPSPITTSKAKRKEKTQQTMPLQSPNQQQLPVVVNQPRLPAPVSHSLFPQHNIQSQSNAIIIQNQNGIQTLQPQSGIQIMNNQGALQALQPTPGIQVLTNQGIQTIQPQGGLQVVQNVQDGVSLLGSQPTQGGYQIVQTPTGIQMVPVQPSFQPIQSGIPLMPGYQPQNMGPISMINMNITNNLQAPMQTFQTNLPTLQGGMPMISGPIQPLGANMMPPQVFQCMNQSGELVAVTPLFQIPVEQMQPAAIQGNIVAQNLNQGLVQMPLNIVPAQGTQIQPGHYSAITAPMQQQSESPLNMVCKENPLVNTNQEREEEEENVDVIHT